MIEINLLPEEFKKKKHAAPKIEAPKVGLEKIPVVNTAIAAVGGLIAIQVLLFVIGVLCAGVYNSLDKGYKEISPKKLETENLKIQIGRMGRKVSAIDELMVKRFSWAKKLNDLSDSMTPSIWLTALEYNEKLEERPRAVESDPSKNKSGGESKPIMEKTVSRYLVISGAASSMGEEGTALIGRFIKSLKENPSFYSDFSDIELGNIKRERLEDQDIMTFSITCLFETVKCEGAGGP